MYTSCIESGSRIFWLISLVAALDSLRHPTVHLRVKPEEVELLQTQMHSDFSQIEAPPPDPHMDSLDRLRSEEHTSELQSRGHLVCRLLLEKKKKTHDNITSQVTTSYMTPQ